MDDDEPQFDESPKPKKPYVDPEVLKAYDEYLQDWKERMGTFIRLQAEYMPVGRIY